MPVPSRSPRRLSRRVCDPCFGPLLALVLMTAGPTRADGEPLAPLTAIELALAASPRLRAAEAEVARTEAALRSARAWPAPELTVSPLYSDERALDLEAELALTLHDPTLKPATRVASAALSASLVALAEARREVAAEARKSYFGLRSAERLVAAQGKDVELLRRLRDAAVRGRDLGERPGVDVLRAELELSRAEQELAAAVVEASVARAGLNALLGRQPDIPVAVAATGPAPTTVPSWSDLAPRVAGQPRLRLADTAVELRRHEVALARSQRRPVIELAGFREDQEHGVRLSLRLPAFDLGRVRGEVQAAEAAVRQAEQERDVVRRELTADLARVHLTLVSASERRRRFVDEVLARAERLAELAETGYRIGETSILEVLDARRQLAQVRREAVDLERAEADAWTDLAGALGAVTDWLPAIEAEATPATAAGPAPLAAASRVLGPPLPHSVVSPNRTSGGER